MIAEVEIGKVSTSIVKDMSRFGRNYLKVGFYTEVMSKNKDVRFIAVNNGIDSDNYPVFEHYERMVRQRFQPENSGYL